MLTRFPRAIIVLGLVSLFMDMSSEMLYPVGPIYLTTIVGASMVWLGVIEGIAEAVAGIGKGYFGMLSDAAGKRRPFVTFGYAISAVSKPIPALLANVGGVLGARVMDRIGKGIRTAPRDALLAGYTTPEHRGAAFGLHRGMDTAGAAIGPVIALLYLWQHPGDYATLFLLATLPAILAALLTLAIKEPTFAATKPQPPLRQLLLFWAKAPLQYRKLLLMLTAFALVNASDVFLIMRARESGFSDVAAIAGYIGYNLVFALAAYPAGRLSDRIGRRLTIGVGLLLFALVYGGFAIATDHTMLWALFGLYGLYAALTEGVSKAWVSDLVPNENRGLALGLQTMCASLAALVASSWTGAAWGIGSGGGTVPFIISGVVAAGLSLLLVLLPSPAHRPPSHSLKHPSP